MYNNMFGRNVNKQWLIEHNEPPVSGNRIVLGVTLPAVSFQPREFGASQVITARADWLNAKRGMFISIVISKLLFKFSYAKKPGMQIYKEMVIQLPTKNGKIDFNFMENFIAELEAQRIAKLEVYLSVTGLKDTHLSSEEEQALQKFGDIEWSKFRLGSLFKKIKTNKLPFKADDLPKQMTGKYTLPCLTSSFRNQGLNYFVPKEGTTILKNVISIPSNSDVYRAYFQSNEFTVLSDAYAIRWIFNNTELSPIQYLFIVSCINKVANLPIYSYKNKLGGWNVVKNKFIQLPVKIDKPDYEMMKSLISAIQKLVIKDVVLYADRKIAATKAVIK